MNIIFETKRLVLREWSPDDNEVLSEILADPEVMKFIGGGKPFSVEQTNEFLNWARNFQKERGFCRWAVIEKENGEIIGSCGFAFPHQTEEVELGYLFTRRSWGKGFATEAAGACLHYGFEKLKFPEVIALTDEENVASRRVLEKIGFVSQGVKQYNNENCLVYLAKNPENNLNE